MNTIYQKIILYISRILRLYKYISKQFFQTLKKIIGNNNGGLIIRLTGCTELCPKGPQLQAQS